MSQERKVTVEGLRRSFDEVFAAPVPEHRGGLEDLLLVRVARQPYALRLTQISALHQNRKLIAVPTAVPAFVGLVGFRGAVVPAYDLGMLLGHGAVEEPRWLVLRLGESPLAFCFEDVEHHLRVEHDAQVAAPAHQKRPFVLRHPRLSRPLLDLTTIAESVASHSRHDVHAKEP